jgi:hypothetical protein
MHRCNFVVAPLEWTSGNGGNGSCRRETSCSVQSKQSKDFALKDTNDVMAKP